MLCMGRKFTAVIADDENSIRQGLSSMGLWERLNIDIVAIVDNGKDALKAIETLKPDFALMDVMMPGMTGLDALERIRIESLDTDIIILSGHDKFDFAKRAIKYEAKEYLLKPVSEDELEETLSRLIVKRGEAVVDTTISRTMLSDIVAGRKIATNAIIAKIIASSDGLADGPVFALVIHLPEESRNPSMEMERIHEAMKGIGNIAWFQSKNMISMIINGGGQETPVAIASIIMDSLKTHPTIATGDIVMRISEISYSYSRALIALSYIFYYPTMDIFTSDLIAKDVAGFNIDNVDTSPIEEAVLLNDRGAIEKSIGELSSRTDGALPPPSFASSAMYALLSKVWQRFSPLTKDSDKAILSASTIMASTSFATLKKGVVDNLKELASFIDEVYGEKRAREILRFDDDDEVIAKAKEFIHIHIKGPLLIEEIAKTVNLSPSYFAIYFRRKTGVKLRDYILEEKVEWAKKRLREQDASVNEIAESLGYSDYRSFSRAFKNVAGMTPSEFMERT